MREHGTDIQVLSEHGSNYRRLPTGGVDNGHLYVCPKVSSVHGTKAGLPQEARTDAAIAGVRHYAKSPR